MFSFIKTPYGPDILPPGFCLGRCVAPQTEANCSKTSTFSHEIFLEESFSLWCKCALLPVRQQAFISQLKGPVTEWERWGKIMRPSLHNYWWTVALLWRRAAATHACELGGPRCFPQSCGGGWRYVRGTWEEAGQQEMFGKIFVRFERSIRNLVFIELPYSFLFCSLLSSRKYLSCWMDWHEV